MGNLVQLKKNLERLESLFVGAEVDGSWEGKVVGEISDKIQDILLKYEERLTLDKSSKNKLIVAAKVSQAVCKELKSVRKSSVPWCTKRVSLARFIASEFLSREVSLSFI